MDLNRFLEEDVPDCYFSMAVIQASINHYLLYEAWAGEPESEDVRTHRLEDLPAAKSIVDRLNVFMDESYRDNLTDTSERKEAVLKFREEIKQTAMAVATYTDEFRLYEYLINRVKPDEKTEFKSFNNDAMARDVLTAIFKSGDNAVINENIKTCVSNLPLRMTKNKFFDIIEGLFNRYIDTDSSSLDREIYMLRSSAGIYERRSDMFPELEKRLLSFRDFNFAEMNDNSYNEAMELLKDTVSVLTDISELLQVCEQVVNLLTVMLAMYSKVTPEFRKDIVGLRVLTDEALDGFKNNCKEPMSPEALGCFEAMEGKFEPLVEKLSRIQAKVATAYKGNLELTAPDILEDLDLCERLLSGSVFADLKDEESHELTSSEVKEKFNVFRDELSAKLSEDDRYMLRARMSAVLGQLPVFFDSRTEVMNYVRESLDGCRDVYEKMVSVRLIMDTINHIDK